MGEIADYYINKMIGDAIDVKIDNLPKPKKTCKFCGKDGLTWKMLDGNWVLHSGNVPHSCHYVVCKRCGEQGLKWVSRKKKRILVDKQGNKHDCWNERKRKDKTKSGKKEGNKRRAS